MIATKQPVIGVSCGDVNGISLEILMKIFLEKALFKECILVLYVPVKILVEYKKKIKFKNFTFQVIQSLEKASPNKLNIVDFHVPDIHLNLGKSTNAAAQVAVNSLDLAIKDLKNNFIDILLTLPLNKQNISLIKQDFIGHTEYLSERFNNKTNLMLLCGNNLKIATVTNHISVSKVSDTITKPLLESKIDIFIKTLKRDFLILKPKIGLLSLNPHCGDNGLIGEEDDKIIAPVVSSLFSKGYLVYGPYAADGFFGSRNYMNFDGVLGMYHDQALIPFKTLSFGNGVNYTSGLPIIRVSPDHGVGYDIAGKGIANHKSLLSSVLLGLKIYSNRKVFLRSGVKTQSI